MVSLQEGIVTRTSKTKTAPYHTRRQKAIMSRTRLPSTFPPPVRLCRRRLLPLLKVARSTGKHISDSSSVGHVVNTGRFHPSLEGTNAFENSQQCVEN